MPQATERPAISRAEYERRVAIRRKRLRRKRIQRGIIALIILAVLIIGIVLICQGCSSGSSITGTWDYDIKTIIECYYELKRIDIVAELYELDGEASSIDFFEKLNKTYSDISNEIDNENED